MPVDHQQDNPRRAERHEEQDPELSRGDPAIEVVGLSQHVGVEERQAGSEEERRDREDYFRCPTEPDSDGGFVLDVHVTVHAIPPRPIVAL